MALRSVKTSHAITNMAICIPALNLSLGHHFTEIYNATKRWPSDKFKENFETYLKVHCYAAILKL